MADADDAALVAHCAAVGARIPIVGFYLQSSVGGRPLSYAFWRRFAASCVASTSRSRRAV
jgi:hypothetical protein